MKLTRLFLCFLFTITSGYAFASYLDGFTVSPYYYEQVKTITFNPDVRIVFNAPSIKNFDPSKSTRIILFSLPNGNTIEQTFGKVLNTGDDWHFDIQHIGAQTRFLRNKVTDCNIITVYLENTQKSWPAWRSANTNNAQLISQIIDTIKNTFKGYKKTIELNSHSGGGSFIFGYWNGVSAISNDIERISFLDSDYNYDDSYAPKIVNWINAKETHTLCVIAYNDSVALYNGAPVVSATGGTWYRSKMMQKKLAQYYTFQYEDNDDFLKYSALNGRIQFILKKNPTKAILHTVQVEKNGFIHSSLIGTPFENSGYTYYGDRAYTPLVQNELLIPKTINFPARKPNSLSGSQFMEKVKNMSFQDRENEIYNEISNGNVPGFLRTPIQISGSFTDNKGVAHNCTYQVLPDYLAIGSDSNFCRIPMGPLTAQKLANLFGAILPTKKLVDNIYVNANVKLSPVTYTPVGNENEKTYKFVMHNKAIDSLRVLANGNLGSLIGGTKKDVIISSKILDNPNNVVIYGWHKLDGNPIQPVYSGHSNIYVDYSHGIRLLGNEFTIDGQVSTIRNTLINADLYKIFSDETAPMQQPSYFANAAVPSQPKSFGIISNDKNSLKVVVKPDASVQYYNAYLSNDGINFTDSLKLSSDMVIGNLSENSVKYIILQACNENGGSLKSEVLCGIPNADKPAILLVHAFDRKSAGNNSNFIRLHAKALSSNSYIFNSATNDAVTDGIMPISNYKMADYILGDESTVDETFSTVEQDTIKKYLSNGGYLFASGSEIAWDVDYKGTTTDKDFCWSYLKVAYLNDAPEGKSATYYAIDYLNSTPFAGLSDMSFDNGTQGTINVKYPDALTAKNGGIAFSKYKNLDISLGASGVCYQGTFGVGSKTGKTVIMGVPFETIYPVSNQNALMQKITEFFGLEKTVSVENKNKPQYYDLSQNYPNPFNPSTTINYTLPFAGQTDLRIYDILGKEIATLINKRQSAGNYNVKFDASNLSSGIYIARLQSETFCKSIKMMLIK